MSQTFARMAEGFAEHPQSVQDLPALEIPSADNPDWEYAEKFRPEMYALSAVMGSLVIDRALTNRSHHPPYGLVNEYKQTVTHLGDFADMRLQLDASLDQARRQIFGAKDQDSVLSHMVGRLAELCLLFQTTTKAGRYEDPNTLIGAGTGTASLEIETCLKAVARLVRNDNPEAMSSDIAEVARRSSGLPRKLAAVNIAHLAKISALVDVAGESTDKVYGAGVQVLELSTNRRGDTFVDFVGPIDKLPAALSREESALATGEPAQFRTLGCPLRARINGEVPITKLWNWGIDIAEAAHLFRARGVYNHTVVKQGH